MVAVVEFWFEFASTYSHPAVQRIGTLAEDRGVPLVWRPFLLGPIFGAQGWADSPFNLYPAKGAYMWRDLERVCAAHGIRWRKPSVFPRNGLTAARVTVAADGEAWQPDLIRALYRANFVDDREIGEPEIVAEVLASIGQDPTRWLERASATETKTRLRLQTERAVELGIFGAPSVTVGTELFWGDDRLEAALDLAAKSD
ncbi:MAG: 2-hydroxychromene-2-carboxylate isomerase [Candidatus Binatia bacterium]|nr:2-hydroxychromene-2-carboxylate isomerase [Candidatus Binatia bacterium]